MASLEPQMCSNFLHMDYIGQGRNKKLQCKSDSPDFILAFHPPALSISAKESLTLVPPVAFDSHGTSCCLWSSWLKHFSSVGSTSPGGKKNIEKQGLEVSFRILIIGMPTLTISPPLSWSPKLFHPHTGCRRHVSDKTWSNCSGNIYPKSKHPMTLPRFQHTLPSKSQFPDSKESRFSFATLSSALRIVCRNHLKSILQILDFNGSCGFFPLVTPCHAMVLSSKKLLSWTLDKVGPHGLQVAPSSAETFFFRGCFEKKSVHRWLDLEIRDSGMGTKWYKFHITFQVIIQIHVIHLDCK